MCDCHSSSKMNLSSLGAYAGGKAGNYLENKITKYAEKARKKFKGWTGFGDYTINANSLLSMGNQRGEMLSRTSGGYTIISYRDYIGDVYTSHDEVGVFNIQHFQIQPASQTTFPWLAPIAERFDEYRMLGCIFEFRSSASENATTSLGQVIMATEYDMSDPPYANRSVMLNSAYCNSGKVSDDLWHGIECDPAESQNAIFFTRNDLEVKTSDDLKEYDLGRFSIATAGGNLPIDTFVGSVYVHYEVALLKEQIPTAVQLNYETFRWVMSGTGIIVGKAQQWLDNFAYVEGANLGVGFDNFGTIYFPQRNQGKRYRIVFSLHNVSADLTPQVCTFTPSELQLINIAGVKPLGTTGNNTYEINAAGVGIVGRNYAIVVDLQLNNPINAASARLATTGVPGQQVFQDADIKAGATGYIEVFLIGQ